MSNQLSARIIGILILISTSSYMVADDVFVTPILSAPNYLELAYLNKNSTLATAVSLFFINSVAIIAAAIVLFPLVKQVSERSALTYLTCRVVEGILLLLAAAALLSIANLGKEMMEASSTNSEWLNSMAMVARRERYTLFQFAMLALALGSIVLNLTFYRYKMIPKVLSALGVIGYTFLLVKMVGDLFAVNLGGGYLYAPGALFELLLPFWLLFKGIQLPSNAQSTN
ncbi:DUF4386 domain-containing protein [Pseudoalteromonas xiamenensis]